LGGAALEGWGFPPPAGRRKAGPYK
jgi:hypothetical protein